MNRYLLAALYVMAGCAVTVPLKAQTGTEILRMDRCRVMLVNTVKVVSICLEEDEKKLIDNVRSQTSLPEVVQPCPAVHCCRVWDAAPGSLCRTSCKIRAPGNFSLYTGE